MATRKVTDAEALATNLPLPDYSGWSGLYCHDGHPPGEALANDADRKECWGCGRAKEAAGIPKGQGTPVTVMVSPAPRQPGN
jgi:hypothetical protein